MRAILVQKCIAFSVVAASLALLTPLQMFLLIVVFGHAHFLAAYYYQWKAGKWTLQRLGAFIAATAGLLIAATVLTLDWFIVCSAIIFYLHHFQDEPLLFNTTRSAYRTLELYAPFSVFCAVSADLMLGTHITPYVLLSTCLALICILMFALRGSYRPDALSWYLCAVTAGVSMLWFSGISLPPEKFIGSIILFHYISWLVYFYFRFGFEPIRQKAYGIDMLAIHGVVFLVLAIALYGGPALTPLMIVFSPIFFYIAALLHIFFTVRPSDYRAAITW